MGKLQENLNSESIPQVASEGPSAGGGEASPEEGSFKLKQAMGSKKENPINEDSNGEKKTSSENGWQFFLVLLITLGVCAYFYIQKKEIDLATILPGDLKKSFPVMTNAQSKEASVQPTTEIVEQTGNPSAPETIVFEDEKTINLLRHEIQSLKSELEQKNSPPLPQNAKNESPHISGGVLGEETKIVTQKKVEEPELKMETSEIPLSSKKISPAIQQNQIPKVFPKRSKEVQAYLDFVEYTGEKIFWVIKEGWARLQTLFL